MYCREQLSLNILYYQRIGFIYQTDFHAYLFYIPLNISYLCLCFIEINVLSQYTHLCPIVSLLSPNLRSATSLPSPFSPLPSHFSDRCCAFKIFINPFIWSTLDQHETHLLPLSPSLFRPCVTPPVIKVITEAALQQQLCQCNPACPTCNWRLHFVVVVVVVNVIAVGYIHFSFVEERNFGYGFSYCCGLCVCVVSRLELLLSTSIWVSVYIFVGRVAASRFFD